MTTVDSIICIVVCDAQKSIIISAGTERMVAQFGYLPLVIKILRSKPVNCKIFSVTSFRLLKELSLEQGLKK